MIRVSWGEDSLRQLFIWFDASYVVHPNLKSHTRRCMSFGYGVVHCMSSNQKMNTKISTESRVVSVSDYLPYNI